MRTGRRFPGGALLLGGAVLLGALVFGSKTLGVAGIGLLVAGGGARSWAALVRSRVSAAVSIAPSPAREGDRVRLRIEVSRASRVPVGSGVVRASFGRLGTLECRLRGHGRRLDGQLALGGLPRGRFAIADAELQLADPLCLEPVSLPLELPLAVVVHPRLVELESLFSEEGHRGAGGRRLLLRRHAGFEFHSVREHEQGESLRRVHWPTTARRGQLMVKELEDPPRDVVAVVLDCDPAGAAGTPPDSSFDAAVRAAGSILRAFCVHGRGAALVTTGSDATTLSVGSLQSDFAAALGMLAAVEPDAEHRLDRALAGARGALSQAGELVVVTSSLEPKVVDRLLEMAARRLVSLVWVDAPSWAGRPTRSPPGLLRLNAAGVPVAALRRGDDLGAVLEAPARPRRAHG